MFCSDKCQHYYHSMMNSRRKRGDFSKPEFCKNCGKILQWRRKDYCSPECRGRREHPEYQIAGINALRFAALRQAKKDKALKQWMQRKSFYELFPELTPEQLGRKTR